MYFHDSGTRPTKQLLPGVLARTFWGEKMLLSLVDLHPMRSSRRTAIRMSRSACAWRANSPSPSATRRAR